MQRIPVVIIGAGPSGLLLGHLLHQAGIDNVIVERRSPDYVLGRIRAGILEQGLVAMLDSAGLSARLHREGLVHRGIEIATAQATTRIDLHALTGKHVHVYGQAELTHDLMSARAASGGITYYEATKAHPSGFDSHAPSVTFQHQRTRHTVHCDFIVGCDGFHGVSRASVPKDSLQLFERVYPFGWLGLLCDAPPVTQELRYIQHSQGFALCSMRSSQRARYYLQCSLSDRIEDWSDRRFFDALRQRLDADTAARLMEAPAIEKSIAPLRSVVVEPLRFGRLFLCGDAGHIVPPTGAKGLNLAASDVHYLSEGLIDYYRQGKQSTLDAYSQRALRRIWRAERFSWWMTLLLHRFDTHSSFDERMQQTELEHTLSSTAAMTMLAENYAGLPY